MPRPEVERKETSLFGTSGDSSGMRTWDELLGLNLSVEFVDGHKGLLRLDKIANDRLYGKKLGFSPREMNLVETGDQILLQKEYIREVSLVEIKVVRKAVQIHPE